MTSQPTRRPRPEEGESLTEALAVFGIRHEPASDGRRFLYARGLCIGMADVKQGWALVELLRAIEIGAPA